MKTQSDYRRENITEGKWKLPDRVPERVPSHLSDAWWAAARSVHKIADTLSHLREEEKEAKEKKEIVDDAWRQKSWELESAEKKVQQLVDLMEQIEGGS